MSRDFFTVTGKPNDGRPVHMVRRHPETDRIGCWSTPSNLTRTACEKTWADGHATCTIDLVTCETCRAWCADHPNVFVNGVYDRMRDGGKFR